MMAIAPLGVSSLLLCPERSVIQDALVEQATARASVLLEQHKLLALMALNVPRSDP